MPGVKRNHGSMIFRGRPKHFRIGHLIEIRFINMDYIETLLAQERRKINPNLLVEEQFGSV